MAQSIPKTIKELCTPAAVYFIISFISLFVIAIIRVAVISRS